MKHWLNLLICLALLSSQGCLPALSQAEKKGDESSPETQSNVSEMPVQILKTGVSLSAPGMSANTRQLANSIGLLPVLEQIQSLRARIGSTGTPASLENLWARRDLYDARELAASIIQKTNLDIDFAIAEIDAETQLYSEILGTFTGERDKYLTRINAASFISNGILWAACEGMAIPCYNTTYAINPKHVCQWPIPSGIVGIVAGVIPSVASMYTLKAANGKFKTSESDPNMLSKVFGYPTNPDIEYPRSVWDYLQQVPADQPAGKKRMDQIVDRWIADSNIHDFTSRKSKAQLNVITASIAEPRGLSIGTLTARSVMLTQLHSEIMKMKRMLLELDMALIGEKQV